MTIRFSIGRLFLVATFALLAQGVAIAEGELSPSSTERALFLDDSNIEEMQNVRRVVNQPLKHPGNPILTGDKPWDAYRPQLYGTVIFDAEQKLFKMWYLAIPDHALSGNPSPVVGGVRRLANTTLVGYATSEDGIHWQKPNLGVLEFNGSKENSLVNMGRDNTEGVSVLYEPQDPNPDRRYKAMFWEHTFEPAEGRPQPPFPGDARADGMWVSFSRDGVHWNDYEHNPAINAGSDSGQTVLFDPKLKKYVLFSRVNVGRRISRATSDDFIHWTNPELVFAADEKDSHGCQIYGSGFCIYEGVYLGMPWMFHEGTSQRIDVQLIHSKDGIHWNRTEGREPFLPNGPEGAWDSGIIFTACQPVVLEDRILIYYFGMVGDHHGHPQRGWDESKKYYRGSLGLATLRRDGWVSLDIPFVGGHVTTKLVEIPSAADGKSPKLFLNTNAFTGDVQVSLLDENGSPIPGFENSENLHGDFLRAEVKWPGHTLAEISGRKAKLKIHGRLAKVYSFWLE